MLRKYCVRKTVVTSKHLEILSCKSSFFLACGASVEMRPTASVHVASRLRHDIVSAYRFLPATAGWREFAALERLSNDTNYSSIVVVVSTRQLRALKPFSSRMAEPREIASVSWLISTI